MSVEVSENALNRRVVDSTGAGERLDKLIHIQEQILAQLTLLNARTEYAFETSITNNDVRVI